MHFSVKMAQTMRFPHRNATVVAADSGPAEHQTQSDKKRTVVIPSFRFHRTNDDDKRRGSGQTCLKTKHFTDVWVYHNGHAETFSLSHRV
jgi:hypothetical protein